MFWKAFTTVLGVAAGLVFLGIGAIILLAYLLA